MLRQAQHRRDWGDANLRALPWRSCGSLKAIAAWQALAEQAAEPNPFFEHWYLLPSLRALDPDGEVRLLCYSQGETLLGLMPVARQASYYGKPVPHLASWTHPNSFLGAPLVASGHEGSFWRAVLDWADRQDGAVSFLHVADLPEGGPVAQALASVLGEGSRPHGTVHREERALLATELAPEEYLAASLSGKKRKELRRQMKRLSEEGAAEFNCHTDDSGLAEWTREFLALEGAGWKGKAGSALASAPETAHLFEQALAGAAAVGKLERLCLSLNGQPIAMLASFLSPPGAFSYKTAFDENFARFSPGVQLQMENLKLIERPAISWVDSCASADHPMIDHIWRERRCVVRQSIGIGGPLRRAAFRALLNIEQRRNPVETKA